MLFYSLFLPYQLLSLHKQDDFKALCFGPRAHLKLRWKLHSSTWFLDKSSFLTPKLSTVNTEIILQEVFYITSDHKLDVVYVHVEKGSIIFCIYCSYTGNK